MVDLEGYEGPRPPRPDEYEALLELSRSIFFPDRAHFLDGAREWPMALHPEFLENTLAIFHQGAPVSMIGRLERDIAVYGHRLRLGYIGGVCTHPEHRKRGLAGAIQNASLQLFGEHGVDLVYISGTRPMYYGAGADHVGAADRYAVLPGALPRSGVVRLREAGLADVSLLCRLNEADATRVVRTPADYEVILTYRHCAGRPCEFRVAEVDGVCVGYLFIGRDGDSRHVMEFRGERLAALAGLAELAGEAGSVTVDVPHGDLLGDLLRAHGVAGTPGRTPGTVKVVDFSRTMGKLAPYFASHLDPALVGSLRFVDAGSRYLVLSDAGTLTIDGESSLLWTLLGAPGGESVTGVSVTGEMACLLQNCLPIPLPSVYLNMI